MHPVPLKIPSSHDLSYVDLVERAPRFVWKRFGDGCCLETLALFPKGHDLGRGAAAVAFFHGGMWRVANSAEFFPWALQLAARGVVCFIPSYRTRAEFEVSTQEILQDASDFWGWMLGNAQCLGLDEQRLCLAGCDAGGLMALHAGMPPIRRRRLRDMFRGRASLPPLPACIALFRGVVDFFAPEISLLEKDIEDKETLEEANPPARLGRHLPALFSAHGMLDPLLDYRRSEWFAEEWAADGNKAQCISCPHGDHAFLYFNVNPVAFEQVLFSWEAFMVELGVWHPSQAEGELLLS